MPRPPRIHLYGGFYHVLARGNAGQTLCHGPEDYAAFLWYLEEARRLFDTEIHAFCLMPNHLHLLVRTWNLGLTTFMHRVLSRFAMRFNLRRGEHGHVFQDRFKSLFCRTDRYFLAIVRYIHNNPVKACLVRNAWDWEWSSLQAYGGRPSRLFVSRDTTLGYFAGDPDKRRMGFLEFQTGREVAGLEAWLEGERRGACLPSDLGAPEERVLGSGIDDLPAPMGDLESLLARVGREVGIGIDGLRGGGRSRRLSRARDSVVLAAVQAGHRSRAVAAALRLSEGAVSLALKRASGRLCGT